MEGTVDTLTIKIETQGAEKAQKSLSDILSAIDKFKAVGAAMQGVAQESEDAAEGIAQAGEQMEVTLPQAEKSTSVLKKLGEGFKNAVGHIGKFIATAGKAGMTSLFKNLGKSMSKAVESFKNFASALKRIAMYRALRSLIKAITQAVGEGIKNIYYYSRIVGTDFAGAMDRAKSASTTFKNSIGAALAPVLQSLIPILEKVCGWLTAFNNLLAKIFAILRGDDEYTIAVATTVKWGDALDKAAGSAKELKRQLMGFDELNVLNDNSGGGGGGGASTPDYASMFERVKVDPNEGMFKWLTDFKLVFSDVVLDWSNINGEQLAEKIISGLFTVAGLMIGGIPGAIVGFLLSLFLNKIIFNRDGKLDAEEIATLVVGGLLGLTGAIAGGLIGGVPGAVIGFGLGVILSMTITKAMFDGNGKLSKEETIMLILSGLMGIGGGVVGFLLGGVPGALIGFSLGVILTLSIEGIFQKATGYKDPVKAWLYGLIGKEYSEDGVDVDVNVVPNVELGDTSSVNNWLGDLNGIMNAGGSDAANSFYTGYDKTAKKEQKTRSATSNKFWTGISNNTVDILSNTDFNKAFSTMNQNEDKAMKLVKDGDRTRWVTESQYVTDILKATDVTTPFQVMNTSMQAEWDSMKRNTDGSAGAVSKIISDKISSTNVITPMNKLKSDLGTSFTGINTLTGTKMTQVGGTMADKIRATDIVTPMESLKSKLAKKFDEMKTNTTGTGSTISSNLTTAFTNMKANIIKAVTTLQSGLNTPFNAISTAAAQTTNNVAEAVRQAIIAMNKYQFTVPNWVSGYGGRTFSFNANVPPPTKYTPMLMAEGGIVDKGQLFIARESGAELIGAYGHQTGVMNNDQIVESVSEGVYKAVVEAMGDRSTTVNIDGRQLFEIVTERNNAQVRRTGRSPLLT